MTDWETRMSETRMSERARRRAALSRTEALTPRFGVFAQWAEPDDPVDILPDVLAARCLGISYGDPGLRLPDSFCRQCWGDRYVWLGNGWGLYHTPPGLSDCDHACHQDEVWMASPVVRLERRSS